MKIRSKGPRKGSKWLCIKNFPPEHGKGLVGLSHISYTSGIVYKSVYDGKIMDNNWVSYFWSNQNTVFNLYKYFRQIPRNKRCCLQI